MSMWVYADGTSGNDPSGNSGVIFPRGTAGVIFQDGIIWGGIVNDGVDPKIRVGGQTYTSGTVPGSILSQGVSEDFGDPSVNRVWRIRRDYFRADLTRDAAEINLKGIVEVTQSEIDAVRTRYDRDWAEWPWQKGAPFYDADGDGAYTPQFNPDGAPKLFPEADEPGLAAADQVIWFVMNDLDPGRVIALYGSPAMGLEVQATLWAYKSESSLANVIFKRYRLIYQGTASGTGNANIERMHITQWSDPDLGTSTDDFVGCDVPLDLGYVYNSNSLDIMFDKFKLPPPAAGYDFLAGPLVRSPSDFA
ncbi:MAG: hypothetical protein O7G31_06675, partial [Calditrichaeota bacterium]|nr:hypothetical protein [Calditrichota bacterium]